MRCEFKQKFVNIRWVYSTCVIHCIYFIYLFFLFATINTNPNPEFFFKNGHMNKTKQHRMNPIMFRTTDVGKNIRKSRE